MGTTDTASSTPEQHMARDTALIPSVAQPIPGLDLVELRTAIQDEYAIVATDPGRGFHFHTGRPLARLLGYDDAWLDGIPEATIASFAGTGNPFALGMPRDGEFVVDVGCGAGIDSLIASRMVGARGRVIGIDMTLSMVERASTSAEALGATNVKFELGYAERLPVPDGWADVVISNGVMNLFPDKLGGLQEMVRVLKPGGRLQIGDILVSKTVPLSAKRDIDLWKG
jgi:SAM-dependent methyltransferase